MIVPTVGRKVWYRPSTRDAHDMNVIDEQPLDATIVYVHGERLVNLLIVDHHGIAHARRAVQLDQGDEPVGMLGHAEWMPYQQGQAAKTESTANTLMERVARLESLHGSLAGIDAAETKQ